MALCQRITPRNTISKITVQHDSLPVQSGLRTRRSNISYPTGKRGKVALVSKFFPQKRSIFLANVHPGCVDGVD